MNAIDDASTQAASTCAGAGRASRPSSRGSYDNAAAARLYKRLRLVATSSPSLVCRSIICNLVLLVGASDSGLTLWRSNPGGENHLAIESIDNRYCRLPRGVMPSRPAHFALIYEWRGLSQQHSPPLETTYRPLEHLSCAAINGYHWRDFHRVTPRSSAWLSSCAGVAQPWPRASGRAARAESDGGLGRVCLRLMRGVIRERTRRRGFRLLANELARRESLDLT